MIDTDSPDESRTVDVFCGDCNVLVAARVVASYDISPFRDPDIGCQYDVADYFIAVCGRCEGVFFVLSEIFGIIPEPHIPTPEEKITVLYPSPQRISAKGLPEKVARMYSDAVKASKACLYRQSAMTCRLCVEAVCKEFEATQGSLQNRLEALRRKGKIDEKLFEWANELRSVGNDAAHDLETEIEKEDAQDALDFTEAILMYAFALDGKFEAFRKRRESLGKTPAPKPTEDEETEHPEDDIPF